MGGTHAFSSGNLMGPLARLATDGLRLQPDSHVTSNQCWRGSLPPHTDWVRFEDRLIRAGWYPKSAVQRLRVYGTPDGHELVIEPASREIVVRIHQGVPEAERIATAASLASTIDRLTKA